VKKIFGTDGVRCIVNQEPMTAETCLKIAKTTGYLLSFDKKGRKRVVISKDTRLSGYLFEPLMTAGFISMGMDVILVGPLPTPALPMLIKSLRADMGVMITASHNNYKYNGLKFFDNNGNKIVKTLEKKIENIVFNKTKYNKIINLTYESGKALRLEDAQGRYSEYLKSTIEKKTKLKKLKIVLDCANGATYHVAPNLFWEIGCDVITINNHPDGKNINANCGAVNINELSKFYFVHSYYFRHKNEKDVIAQTEYDILFPSVIKRENIVGTQFHPEKSQNHGIQFLYNFLKNYNLI